nr:MAG TPA: hypothetical protein [Crassvirales sp.]
MSGLFEAQEDHLRRVSYSVEYNNMFAHGYKILMIK